MNATDFPLAFSDRGSGSPPLVLLHAFPLDRTMWQPQCDTLSSRARVLAVDLPGFGDTPAAAFTVDSAADGVVHLLDALGIDHAIVGGLSMGGYVALAVARRHGHRLAGLILADTRAEADDDTARQNRGKMLTLVQERGAAGIIDTMLPKLICDITRSRHPDLEQTIRQLAEQQSPEAIQHAIVALRDRPNAINDLTRITVPTLVLVGDQDAITPPSAARAIADAIQGSQLILIPNAGHLSNLENPAAFNAAIVSFLNTITGNNACRCP